MTKNHPLPPPDMSGTDPDAVLRRRISIPDPTTPAPSPTSPAPAHTQVALGAERVREGREGKCSRPDPAGMRRTSLYITKEAADALEAAADQVLAILGGDTPRHVALSALLLAGVGQAQTVARQLAEQQAAELSTRLAALQQASGG